MPPKKSANMEDVKKELKKQTSAIKAKVTPKLTPEELALKEKKKKEKSKEYRVKASALSEPSRTRAKEKIKLQPVTNTKVAIANEEAIRKLFTKIIELPDEEFIFEMEDFFINHQWRSRDESQEMSSVINSLSRSMYKDLATNFLEEDLPFYLFWAKYKSRPYVLLDIEKKKGEIESLSLPAKRSRGPKFVFPSERRRNKVEIRKPGDRKVIELDEEGKVIEIPEPKSKVEKPFGEAKLSLSILPFDNFLKEKKISIIDNVLETFITPVGTEEQKKHLESIIRAKGISETRTEKGITWYLVDESLDLFLCETNRIWIDSLNSVRAILPNKQNIYFKVGYLISGSDTIFNQTRGQFKIESEYINTLRKTRDGEIQGILESLISPKIRKFVRNVLSQSLSDVATDVTKYKNPEQEDGYIYKSVQKMIEFSGTSTKKLFQNLAKITVFLQDSNSIFAERVRDEFYIPEILVTLTDQEKLPEVFDDPNQNIETTKKFITRKIDLEVKRFAKLLYKTNNPTVTEPTLPSHAIKPPYNVLAWKKPCTNKLNDVKKSDVFYYTEDGQVYCLLISDIYKQIKDGKDPFNPNTNKPINYGVLKRFRELYDFKFDRKDDKVVETPTPGKPISRMERLPPHRQEKIAQIAPWLLKIIKKNIKGCEEELRGMDLEGKDKDKKCPALDAYDETDDETIMEKESEEEPEKEPEKESEEEPEEEPEEESEEDSSKQNTEDSFSSSSESKSKSHPKLVKTESYLSVFGSSPSDADTESKSKSNPKLVKTESYLSVFGSSPSDADTDSDASSSHSPRSVVITKGNICQYCKKNIKKNHLKKCLKTKIRDNQDQDKTIWFCTFECFENYKFPYYKNKNKNKNGRKGGRYGSQDWDIKKK